MSANSIKLSELPRRLRKDFAVEVSYRRVYTAVLDGAIPAEKDASGTRWEINVDDLPEIAKAMTSVHSIARRIRLSPSCSKARTSALIIRWRPAWRDASTIAAPTTAWRGASILSSQGGL